MSKVNSLILEAIALIEKGNCLKAISLLSEALTLDQTRLDAKYNLSDAYIKLGETGKAKVLLQELNKLLTDDAAVSMLLGLVSYKEGHYSEAEALYKKALLLKSDFGDAYNNLGVLYFNKEEYEKAYEMFKSALTFMSKSLDVLINIRDTAEVLKMSDDYKKYQKMIDSLK